MYDVKGQLSKIYFKEMGIFFLLNFLMHYFVGIFSEPPKSLLTNKLRNGSIFDKTSQK